MKKIILLVTMIVGSMSYAAPTLNGPTGLVTMPTAEVLDYKATSVAFDYLSNMSNSDSNQSFYKMNVGAFENTELGFVGGTEPDEGVFLNLKWAMTANTGRYPLSMAVGFQNLTADIESNFYMVASKKLKADFGLHAGFKAVFADQIDLSFMAGADYAYNENLVVMADLNSFEGDKYYLNIGFNYKLTQIASVDNIYIRLSANNVLQNSNDDSFVNVGIAFMSQM
jgi:hypothetical protein